MSCSAWRGRLSLGSLSLGVVFSGWHKGSSVPLLGSGFDVTALGDRGGGTDVGAAAHRGVTAPAALRALSSGELVSLAFGFSFIPIFLGCGLWFELWGCLVAPLLGAVTVHPSPCCPSAQGCSAVLGWFRWDLGEFCPTGGFWRRGGSWNQPQS